MHSPPGRAQDNLLLHITVFVGNGIDLAKMAQTDRYVHDHAAEARGGIHTAIPHDCATLTPTQ